MREVDVVAPSVGTMVVIQGLRLAVVGALVGLLVAGVLSSFIDSLLFGVGRMDLPTYLGVALNVLTAASLASWLPARRATRVDPSSALRVE